MTVNFKVGLVVIEVAKANNSCSCFQTYLPDAHQKTDYQPIKRGTGELCSPDIRLVSGAVSAMFSRSHFVFSHRSEQGRTETCGRPVQTNSLARLETDIL